MSMKIVNKSYFCEIIVTLKNQPKSFNDILRDVKISPSTLNRRIKELTKFDLIEPIIVRVNDENRIKYRLTKKGEVLIGDFVEFYRLYQKLDESIVSKSSKPQV